jgi:hypothetical protein
MFLNAPHVLPARLATMAMSSAGSTGFASEALGWNGSL